VEAAADVAAEAEAADRPAAAAEVEAAGKPAAVAEEGRAKVAAAEEARAKVAAEDRAQAISPAEVIAAVRVRIGATAVETAGASNFTAAKTAVMVGLVRRTSASSIADTMVPVTEETTTTTVGPASDPATATTATVTSPGTSAWPPTAPAWEEATGTADITTVMFNQPQ
jgi:hypothetical protein